MSINTLGVTVLTIFVEEIVRNALASVVALIHVHIRSAFGKYSFALLCGMVQKVVLCAVYLAVATGRIILIVEVAFALPLNSVPSLRVGALGFLALSSHLVEDRISWVATAGVVGRIVGLRLSTFVETGLS